MQACANKLANGMYKIGKHYVSYRRAQLMARKAGFMFLAIYSQSGLLLDYVDLA